ncbi:biotin synthase BioB [Paenibacillus pasadenensis]|uniref:biotin synthase BioB n=1 Tax=Paenibacillus TaxID=44249 RepID=UPI0003F7CBB1|nr:MULTISPECIES: biotin synthase BioB [Paenibacillus]QGG58203.1 biotin synthase BioB [Paenibacillus sp. B01]
MPHPVSAADGPSLWEKLADKALAGSPPSREEARLVLEADRLELLPLLQAAFRVRSHHFGRKVKLNRILNAKSGLCPEDCGYCSQSIVSSADIASYALLRPEAMLEAARKAYAQGVGTFCIVASGRGPSRRETARVAEAVRAIQAELPLKICACLGQLTAEQAAELREAGVQRYNHNLNTSAAHHGQVVSTHSYEDRLQTLDRVREAGLSPCSGIIAGLGETIDDRIEMAFALRELGADSIPVNFLHPVEGTPMGGSERVSPADALRLLALLRFVCPDKEIRVAGGRELTLRSLQPLALYAANSIFLGDYLTTAGQEWSRDLDMLEDLGFEPERIAPDVEAAWIAQGKPLPAVPSGAVRR